MNDTANSHLNQDQPRELAAWLASRRAGGPVHLVGAGGCGMSALGHVLLDLGFTITGSDLAASVETAQLEERGAVIAQGHSAGAVQAAQPILVVFSSAIRPDNPELAAARALAVPVVIFLTDLSQLVPVPLLVHIQLPWVLAVEVVITLLPQVATQSSVELM